MSSNGNGTEQGDNVTSSLAVTLTEFIDDTGIKNEFGEGFNFFPNPTNDKVNINLDNIYYLITASITDIFGKVLENIQFNSVENMVIDIDHPKGVYFNNLVSNDNKSTTFKIIKE